MRIGIDVGGTFTDLIAWSPGRDFLRLKVATTPREPELGALAALAALFATSGIAASEVALVVHASTIATNALLGQMHLTLPRVAFVTTAGFRDVLEIGRQNRSAIYDLNVKRPTPLARREDRFVVHERREADGSASRGVDLAEVDAIAHELGARGIETVAIGLLHAHVDDAHEVTIAERLRERLPGIAISRSADLVREFREYERFSTAVVNAALMPTVRGYLDRFAAGVRAAGVTAPVFAMRSDGGMASIELAAERPAALIESGPAAGVIAAAFLARTMGLERVLSFDMGGTTAKAGTILGGAPDIATDFEAAGATHSGRARKGSGYPVRFPFVDLAEMSAGGGTIAWLDAARTLHVGPLSAGADPGPAAYGRGTAPTVTDANVVLGRLNPRALLGGTFPVDARAASRALATIAEIAHGDVFEAAAAVVAIVDSEMAKVLRIVSVERGHDPRTFALVAFGGGGPLHACGVASDIGVGKVVIPMLPGLFSAFGLLAADVRVATSRTFVAGATAAIRPALAAHFDALQREGERALEAQTVAPADRAYMREIDMRYAGQSFELTVPVASLEVSPIHEGSSSEVSFGTASVGDATVDDASISEASFSGVSISEASFVATIETFHAAHERRYGYAARDEAVEIVTVRVIALGRTEKPRLEAHGGLEAVPIPGDARVEVRDAWDGTRFVATPVYERERIPAGATFDGPAVVEQYDTTTYVAPGWRATVDVFGNLVLEHVRG